MNLDKETKMKMLKNRLEVYAQKKFELEMDKTVLESLGDNKDETLYNTILQQLEIIDKSTVAIEDMLKKHKGSE